VSQTTDAYVAEAADRFVADWRALCQIPSVSGDRAAIAQAADWIETRLGPLFDDIRRIDIPGHGPLLAAVLHGTGDGRVALYTHYDVQPAGDESAWTSPPFSAELRDGCVWARGACDDKADVTARLQGLEAWLSTLDGRPPFTIVFLCDPAEEVGSPGLQEALTTHASTLHADGCVWESFLRDDDGRPGIGFGCRGSLMLKLRLDLLRADQHTAFASVVRSAPLELMAAIDSMRSADGGIVIERFHDDVLEPTAAQLEATRSIPLPTAAVALPGVSPYYALGEDELRRRLVFAPALSLVTFVVGADGAPGVVPASAEATIRFSLLPDQDPDRIVDVVRAHLDRLGYDAIQLTEEHRILPAAAPIDTPFAQALISAAADVFGEPIVYPVLIGAGPGRIVLDALGAPIVSPAGTLRPGGNMHAPDEHGAVDDYLDHVRFSARLLEHLAVNGFCSALARHDAPHADDPPHQPPRT
jgi:acetylornithine deacetylase/succinyl-diaminopimelate desuccinylase-like protein